MRIAVLCHFVWRGGGAGAPRRIDALCKAYEEAGHEVRAISIHDPRETTRQVGPDDIALTADHVRQLESRPWLLNDVAVGRLVAEDPSLRDRFATLLEQFGPDVVQFEFPYLYEPLAPVLAKLPSRPRVVYSAHNAETETRVAVAERTPGNGPSAAQVLKDLGPMEEAMVRGSDLVLAVSEQDGEALRRMDPSARTVVVPNGVDDRRIDAENSAQWRRRFAEAGVTSLCLFVGSKWLPNAEGFFDMLGDDLGWLPGGALVLVVGGTAEDIGPRLFAGGAERSWTNAGRVVLLGRVRDVDLGSLLQLADVMLLPITLGGGSNLKTAEALLSGREVVATSFAMRGFERFIDMPQLAVTDDPQQFRAAIVRALGRPPVELADQQAARLKTLTWEHQTPAMIEAVSDLVRRSAAASDYAVRR